jgi:hypothetical protein
MRDAKRPGGDQGGVVTGAAGDTVDPRRLDGLSQGHRGQDGGAPARQPRLPRPGWANEEDVVGITPALCSVSLRTPKE